MAIKCPKCHTQSPDDTVYCGRCGAKLEAKAQISVTRTLETTPEGHGKGKLFAGRFELIEELGSGGMGKVYRAFDKKINEEVAIKLLRPDIATDEKTVERFRNEIKLARKITHKNICRVHDLHEEGNEFFISMEYVSGQDLKGMIRETGGLSIGKAISIAKQVAEGLAEAHDLGVIHRDLKPQNIMVDKEGSAKIMDFGIARSLRTAGMTAEGMIIGTPEYMAPEQVEGLEADQRTDIYALGAILFEIVTGRVLFEGDTLLSVAYKHKNEPPVPPRKLNIQVPEPLNQLILRCLEKEKENRYQTADDLLADLIRIEDGLPISERVVLKARPAIRISREKPRGLKRILVPALAALCLIIIGFVIWKSVLNKSLQILPEQRRSIAVISFENQTGDPSFSYLSKVIPNLLITGLEQSGYFSVTTWERLRDLLKQAGKEDVEFIDSDLGFELCRRDAVNVIVLGYVTKAGNTFVTDAKVLDVETKKLMGTAKSQGDTPDSILTIQLDDISRQIAKEIGISEKTFEAKAKRIGDLTTSSLEAYNYYLRGLEEWNKYQSDEARKYFEKAVELDPNFALALSKLGGESLKRAMSLAKNTTEKERLYIEAEYFRLGERNIAKAIPIYRQIVNKYPKEKIAYRMLGITSDLPQEAIEMYSRALALDPTYARALNEMGYLHLGLKQPDRALDYFQRQVAVRPGESNPLDSLAEAYYQAGQIDDSLEYYHKALATGPNYDDCFFMLAIAYIHALREDYSSALSWVDKAIITSSDNFVFPPIFLWKGFYLAWLGSFEKSFAYVQMAEDKLSAQGARELGGAIASWMRAWIYYDRCDYERSRKYAETLSMVPAKLDDISFETFKKVGESFLIGLIDLREQKIESAQSKVAEMRSLLLNVSGPGWFFYKETAEFESEWLQNEIQLQEKSLEKAIASLQKYGTPDFVPSWAPGYHILRYNTPFQRDALARAYIMRDDIEKATAEYERLITLDLTQPARLLIHPLYYYRLGMLYEKKGLNNKAKGQYERFLKIWKDADPDLAEVEDAKKRLAGLT